MTSTPTPCDGWRFDRTLGTGGFGIVQLWVHKQSGNKLAIKRCKWDKQQLTETQRNRWSNEVNIMKHLAHPNIVKAINLPVKFFKEEIDLPILCMEYCRKGDLRKVLNKPENCCGISEKEAINVMKDISSAVEYLHSHNITHRDLKPENVVLQNERHRVLYKLIDLGYAKDLGEASACASIVGTLNYVAPELLWKQKYSCSVDYWSLGIFFYELVTGVRPFLPRMQHTITWMQHIKNKGYNDICAFESDGKIIFGQDIAEPTHLSRCLKDKLVQWFRIALQWDPRKRGKECDKNGVTLVIFNYLQSILSKKIVYVFSVGSYKIDAYEVDESASIMDLQYSIEKKTNIPLNEQTLTDYFGKVLVPNGTLLLSQIQDPVLFVFRNGIALLENIPSIIIPMPVQKMIELPRKQQEFETLKDYYRVTIFFIKQEIYFFQLYIFALSIKVDLIIAKLDAFNLNITNASSNASDLLKQLHLIHAKLEKEHIDEEKKKTLSVNFAKVTKLDKAINQIKIKFDSLLNECNELRNSAQGIDSSKEIAELYDKAIIIFETCKNEHPHKAGKPTEMVKLVFDFLKVREAQLRNENISKITKQILKLEHELQTLEKIFESVIAMTTLYRQEVEDLTQLIAAHNKFDTPDSTAMDVSIEPSSSKQSLNVPAADTNVIADVDNDIIYDNLVLRFTLESLMSDLQKNYLDMLSLE